MDDKAYDEHSEKVLARSREEVREYLNLAFLEVEYVMDLPPGEIHDAKLWHLLPLVAATVTALAARCKFNDEVVANIDAEAREKAIHAYMEKRAPNARGRQGSD